jgi:hypothetical protein
MYEPEKRNRHYTCVGDHVMGSHGYFPLGGLLARVWSTSQPLLPWALTSALLSVAAMSDYWSRGGPIDWIVLGLAAYELMIGLLEEQDAHSADDLSWSRHAGRRQ